MSERDFPASIETALSADTAALAFLIYVNWPGGAGRFWSGVGPLSHDGHTWAGAGEVGHIDKIADSLGKEDIGVELTLNYLNDEIRNEVVTNDPVGQDASIYLALLDTDNQVTAAYEIFPGFVDEVEILDSGESGAVKVRLASELSHLSRPIWYQLSDAHQKDLFPGDKGMEFATRMDMQIFWGRKPAFVFTGGGGGGREPRRDRR